MTGRVSRKKNARKACRRLLKDARRHSSLAQVKREVLGDGPARAPLPRRGHPRRVLAQICVRVSCWERRRGGVGPGPVPTRRASSSPLPFPPAHRRLYLYNGQGRVNAEERPGKIVKLETPDLKFAAMSVGHSLSVAQPSVAACPAPPGRLQTRVQHRREHEVWWRFKPVFRSPPECRPAAPSPQTFRVISSVVSQVTREHTIHLAKLLHRQTFKKRAPKAIRAIK